MALPCLWLAAAALIYLNYRGEQAAPQPHGHYFADDTGRSVAVVLVVMIVEVAALALLLPWTLLSMAVSMHAGSAVFLHWVWLLLLDCLLIACAMVSAAAALLARRRVPRVATA